VYRGQKSKSNIIAKVKMLSKVVSAVPMKFFSLRAFSSNAPNDAFTSHVEPVKEKKRKSPATSTNVKEIYHTELKTLKYFLVGNWKD
jgi:hypothetical protein